MDLTVAIGATATIALGVAAYYVAPPLLRIYGHFRKGFVPKDKEALRIGVLGAARITPMALTAPASRMKEVVVASVAARDYRRASDFAKKHGIPKVAKSYEELLADPDIDAVYIPLPNSHHCEWTIKALTAGKHVLCEKPIASNATQAGRMSAAADTTGKVLMEAFHYRYHPAAARIKAILKSGEIGKIKKVDATGLLPFFLFSKDDIRLNYDLAGGSAMDFGCYMINAVRFIMDEEPIRVEEAKAKLFKPQVDEQMEAVLQFESGAEAKITCSLRAWNFKSRIVVTGDKGELVIKGLPLCSMNHSITVKNFSSGATRTETEYGKEKESTYWYQLKAFVQTVRGKEEANKSTKEDAILNMRVIDAIYGKANLIPRGI
jgi:predicted dehydrogenase